MRPGSKGRKSPGYGAEDDQKPHGEPDGHGPELFGVSGLTFGLCRTYGNDDNGKQHHQAVLHSEKTDLPEVHGFLKMIQEIIGDGADQVKPDANEELNVGYGGGPVPDRIVKAGELLFRKPAPECDINGKNQAGQNQPPDQ